MDLEQRLTDLENRVQKLEEREKKRQIWGVIKLVLRIIILIAVLLLGFYAYRMIQEKIAPYQQIVEEYNDSNLQDLIDTYIKK